MFFTKRGKSQAAMEFLMTYGWAILIPLIALGSLFYLGVFSPKSSDSIVSWTAPVFVSDKVITADGVTLSAKAMSGYTANITDMKINQQSCVSLGGTFDSPIITESPTTISCTNLNLAGGKKINIELVIEYQSEEGVFHTDTGSFSGEVEQIVNATASGNQINPPSNYTSLPPPSEWPSNQTNQTQSASNYTPPASNQTYPPTNNTINQTAGQIQVLNSWKIRLGYGGPSDTSYASSDDHSPKIADIDNNGDLEIIVFTKGQLFVFNHDGSLFSGWPKEIMWTNKGSVSSITTTVEDIDGDGDMEIAIGTSYMFNVIVFHHDGTLFSGWPKGFYDFDLTVNPSSFGDVDKDGDLEIGMGALNSFWLWHHDGASVSGWPVKIPNFYPNSSVKVNTPAVYADLDKDGDLEIIFGTRGSNKGDNVNSGDRNIFRNNGFVYVFNHDGTLFDYNKDGKPEWPFKNTTACSVSENERVCYTNYLNQVSGPGPFSRPVEQLAVGDIEGDGIAEIVFITGIFEKSSGWSDYIKEKDVFNNINVKDVWGYRLIYALKPDGIILPGFPVYVLSGSSTGPDMALADMEGDGKLEIIEKSGGYWGGMSVVDYKGVIKSKWKILENSIKQNAPLILDVNKEGCMDILTECKEYTLCAYEYPGCSGRNTTISLPKIPVAPNSTEIILNNLLTPSIIDLDLDGKMDLVFVTSGNVNHNGISVSTSFLNVYELNVPYDKKKIEWDQAYSNIRNTGVYKDNL